ncbi:hypothetical protein CpipJ_CPIJ011592 [Culex quinquefasciatus]|uniref:Uncharacterized protein n=1 Tax=Culex quinquefasciatus TaxID=7176 RepID=B0WXU7_CULQU|nr:hypothetical protein CpipJ_CPIJ011592 [Culex quinquefasciatus]|eukprot:XP_001862219.1 hypothetical protein CpipJ_CPIJ011592 [Culex quinquefasciatus]
MLVVMDPSLRLFALQTIPVLDDSNDTVELFRYICQYFNQRLRLSSPECREELAIIVMSKLRGNRARKAVLMQCKTYEEIEQSLSASVIDAYIFKTKQ